MRTLVVGKPRPSCAAVRLLQADGTMLSTGLKIPTSSDYNVMGNEALAMPGDFALQQVNLEDSDDDSYSSPLLSAAYHTKRVRVLALCKRVDDPWTHKDDERAILAAKGTPANVLVLPSERYTSEETHAARALAASKFGKTQAPHLRVLVGLDVLSEQFRQAFIPAVAAGQEFFPVDLTGFRSGTALSNLGLIAHTVWPPSFPITPFVFGYNSERWVKNDINRGAACLFLRQFGFQTMAYRLYRGGGEDDNGTVQFFDPQRGGYTPHPRTPQIRFPPHLEHPRNLTQRLSQRRWHENVWLSRQSPTAEAHVEAGTFDTAYRASKDLLDATLSLLGRPRSLLA